MWSMLILDSIALSLSVPPLPECQVRHNIIIAASNRKLAPASSSADVYVPKCDEEGKFKMVQCLKSIDKCWCVDNDGNEIENTRTDSQNVNCPERKTFRRFWLSSVVVQPFS